MNVKRPRSFAVIGLLAVIFGSIGSIALLIAALMATNPSSKLNELQQGTPACLWDALMNIALLISGLGILMLRNWARYLIVAYAAISLSELIYNSIYQVYSGLVEPSISFFLIVMLPALTFVFLIYFFSRRYAKSIFLSAANYSK